MSWKYSDIKTEILARINDPAGTRYGSRLDRYFVQAMTELQLSEKYANSPQLPELNKEYIVGVSTSGGYYEMPFTDIGAVLTVSNVISKTVKLGQVTLEEYNRRMDNELLFPSVSEGIYVILSDKIRFLCSPSQNLFDVIVSVRYNPDYDTWIIGDYDLVADLGYGVNFITNCIAMTVQYIKGEIAGEN